MLDALDRMAARQLGLVTYNQLLGLGWTPRQVDHAVKLGRIIRVRSAVYRLRGAPQSAEQHWLAACLASGDDVYLSHWSAAFAYRFLRVDQPNKIHLLAVGERTRPNQPGVTSHATIWLSDQDRHHLGPIPATSASRTFADLCGNLGSHRHLVNTADDLVRRRAMDPRALRRTYESIPVSGRRRVIPLRAVLEERVPGFKPGDSVAEDVVYDDLVGHGISEPVRNYKVRVGRKTYEVDFAWPAVRRGLEWDSWEFHGGDNMTAFHGDREKIRALHEAGWMVDPVTSRTTLAEIRRIARRIDKQLRDLGRSAG